LGLRAIKKLIKPLFIVLGFICLALGTVGIFLPVLPSTPLYLLTVVCFARGSARFHDWFTGTRLYQKHLEGFIKNSAMSMKMKLAICIPVTAMLAFAIYCAPIWHAQVLIGVILLFKWYYFLFRIKTIKTVETGALTDHREDEAGLLQ
jgi:uncharacterized membrane protein YbaN (DUF454 family)